MTAYSHASAGSQRLFTLANCITLASLGASLGLMMQAIQGHFDWLGPLFLLAAACDGLDGFVARKRHTAGPLGMQLDSLVDMVSFGIAPPLAAYAFTASQGHDLPPWVVGLYAACTAIRLVRFNLQVDKSVFFGLNSPSAAALVIFSIWSMQQYWGATVPHWAIALLAAIVAFAALMMVSPFRYLSTKKLPSAKRLSQRLLLAVGVLVVVLLSPYALLAGAAVYALSGPAQGLWRYLKRSGQAKPAHDSENTPA